MKISHLFLAITLLQSHLSWAEQKLQIYNFTDAEEPAYSGGNSTNTSSSEVAGDQQIGNANSGGANGNVAAGSGSTSSCRIEKKIEFNPLYHKRVYTVGVQTLEGRTDAYEQYYRLYGEYLTRTAGKRFNPPIEFEVKHLVFDGIFNAIQNEELDFLYANPGVYSCIGTEVGATALLTGVKHVEVRGKAYDLDVYGGVIAVRADNDQINTISNLKDKIIGAGSIIDLMGGQMQIYEMGKAGMSFFNDPKQVIFTKNQDDIVKGVLNGNFDVGFVRTNQIELTLDENGELIDPELFKIIEPKIFVMENGSLFPFLHSTDIFPEWPLAQIRGVPVDVAHEVQEALLDFGGFVSAGQRIEECRNAADFTLPPEYEDVGGYEDEYTKCDGYSLEATIMDAPCGATEELTELAWEAAQYSLIEGFRISRSYHQLRSVQQEAGFMVQDDKGNWYCTRPSSLYEGITCPQGFFRRSKVEFLNGCERIGLGCSENDNYDCFCKPCVRAYEVDVYEHVLGEEDLHLIDYYGDELPGCEKMSICGVLEQGESITLRIYDNMMRDDATVNVFAHAGETRRELRVVNIAGTHAYEFSVTDRRVGVQVIEILINGEAISQSPIRVNVLETDCDEKYGEKSNREADPSGDCICSNNTYEMAGNCVDSAFFFLIIFSVVFVVMVIFVFFYLGYKKQQNDSVWHINVEELHFNEPPEVIGQGAFGVVVLGQYRGTKVAVKRVLPPNIKGYKNSGMSTGSEHSTEEEDQEVVESTGSRRSKLSGETKGNPKKLKSATDENEKAVTFHRSTSMPEVEAPPERKKENFSENATREWENVFNMDNNDNALKMLESATISTHGSGSLPGAYSGSRSSTSKYIPLWLKFDEHSRLKKEFIVEMRMLSRLRHPCITTVMGAVIAPTVDPMLVMEFMEYGSLYDLLHNETMTAGGEVILQIIRDIVHGIRFLHASRPPILHGDLKAKNILVDSRFRAKVADFGFSHFKTGEIKNVLQGTPFFMAPEYLRRRTEYNAACDIYSLSMIFYEIYARADPFEGEDPRKILPKICHPRINKRPPIPNTCPPKMAEIMKKCWGPNPFFRPSAKDLDYILVELSPMDAEPLENGQETFSDKIKRKPTSLYDVFPKHIADALNAGKKVEAESHEIVTVVFSDIVGFTDISQTFSPLKVSNMLDRLYQAFDAIANKHKVFKVETIGDAYMGVTNLDGSEFDTHVKQIAEYSQDIIAASSQILIDEDEPERGCVKIRVGFHSGPVVSNVIGSLNPRYGLFGDTVNTASRMESNSITGKIHCTYASAKLLEVQAPEIPLKLRGMIKVKGKGKMKTFWVGNDCPTGFDPLRMASFSETDRGAASMADGDDYDDDDDVVLGNSRQTEHNSANTEETAGSSVDHSEQDHYIQVHSSENSHQNHRVSMDGSIDEDNNRSSEKRSHKPIW